MTDTDLDDLFAAARDAAPLPGAGLSARVLADADGVLAARLAPPVPRAAPGLWATLAAVFGGGGVMAGMVSATVAGFYIGFAQPMEGGLVASVLGSEIAELDMMPGLDALLDEAP